MIGEVVPAGRRRPGPGTRRLVVVRHGRTSWNASGRYQGHADVPLDAVGEAQAAALAESLAGLGPDVVVSSDLQRAVATAAPLARRCGLRPVTDPRLREVDVGAWEGCTTEEAEVRFGPEFEAWKAGDVARGGGETRAEAGARAAEALVEHAASVAAGAVVVAVSHGMVLRSALRHLRQAERTDLAGDPPHLGNAEWMELELRV